MKSLCMFNTQVVYTPFKGTGVQISRPNVDPNIAFYYTRKDIPVGARGVREMATRQNDTETIHGDAQDATLSPPKAFMSTHNLGQLLVWSAATHELLGSCSHGTGTMVVECLVSDKFFFTRVEGDAQKGVLEEDSIVYVWDAKTYERSFLLCGHSSRVVAIALHPKHPALLLTAALDYMICVWDLDKNTSKYQCRVDARALGTITQIAWMVHPKEDPCATLAKSILVTSSNIPVSVWKWDGKNLNQAMTTPINYSNAVTAMSICSYANNPSKWLIHTGDTGGYLQEWRIGGTEEKSTAIDLVFQNKLHCASVRQILVDGRVVMSGSLYDGAIVYHRKSGRKVFFDEIGGVWSMLLDPVNKRLLVGSVNGFLWILDYMAFEDVSQPTTHAGVNVLWRCALHTSAISGMVLEVSGDHTWERLTTLSSNGYLTILNYTTEHIGQRLGNAPVEKALATPLKLIVEEEVAAAFVAVSNKETISFFHKQSPSCSTGSVLPPPIIMKNVVTAMNWDDISQTLLVGSRDGTACAYYWYTEGLKPSTWKMFQWHDFPSYYPVSFSNVVGNCVVVCLTTTQRMAVEKCGSLVLWILGKDYKNRKGNTAILHSLETIPIRATLLAESVINLPTACELRPAAVVIKDTQGIIRGFHVATSLADGQKALVERDVFHSSSSYAVSIFTADGEVNTRGSSLFVVHQDEHPKPSGANILMWAEKSMLHRSKVSLLANGESTPMESLLLPTHPEISTPVIITQLHYVGRGAVGAVGLCANSSNAFIIGLDWATGKGSTLFLVRNQGEVLRYEKNQWQSMKLCYTPDKDNQEKSVCTAVSSNRDSRYVALGYDNGLIQLLDTSYVHVFARMWVNTPFPRPIHALWCFDQQVIVHIKPGEIWCFPVYKHVLLDVPL